MSEPGHKGIALGYTNLEGLEQRHLIKMMTAYLTQEIGKYDIEVDKGGICHGLSVIFCKYGAEGKQDEFIKTILAINKKGEAIEALKKGYVDDATRLNIEANQSINDNQINKFIRDVLWAYAPDSFDKRYSQVDSLSLVSVETPVNAEDLPEGMIAAKTSKPLKQLYSLGLVAKTEDWGPIFDKVKAPNTQWVISNPLHSVALSVTDNKFHVYDPNNRKIEVCDDGQALASTLAKMFSFGSGDALKEMPLTVNIVAHPNKAVDFQFPDKKDILDGWLKGDPKRVDQVVPVKVVYEYNSLTMAAMQNDREMIAQLLEHGATDSSLALKIAAEQNRLGALDILLDEKYRTQLKGLDIQSTYINACKASLLSGHINAFKRLLKDPAIHEFVKEGLTDPKRTSFFQCMYLEKALASGNPKCIEMVIKELKKDVVGIDIADTIKTHQKKLFKAATESKNPQCLEMLKELAGMSEPVQKQAPILEKSIAEVKNSNYLIESMISFTEFFKNKLDKLLTSVASGWQKKDEKFNTVKPEVIESQKNFKAAAVTLRTSTQQKEQSDTKTFPTESTVPKR